MKLYSPYIIFLLFALCAVKDVSAQDTPPQDLYCGDTNCYDGKLKPSTHLFIKITNVLDVSDINYAN